jgi:hypothetical protein
MKIFFIVWWKYFLSCDENIFYRAMKIFFVVWWKYFLSCDENIFCRVMKIFFVVRWKYFLSCDENIFCRAMKIFFIGDVWWKYFLCAMKIFFVVWNIFGGPLVWGDRFCVVIFLEGPVFGPRFCAVWLPRGRYIYIYIICGLCHGFLVGGIDPRSLYFLWAL